MTLLIPKSVSRTAGWWRRTVKGEGTLTMIRVKVPPVQPHVPTSVALARLLAGAPADRVSPDWLVAHLQKRSFGFLMLIMALFGLAPGIATVSGFLLAIPAIEMILGRDNPSLPGYLARRSIPAEQFVRWISKAIPLFARLEIFIRPRFHTPFQATKRLIGLIVLLLAATILSPVPFAYVPPTLVIMFISFAYLEEDGVLLCISLVAALLSISFTAVTVWATLRATGMIERLLDGG
ncbi:MAG: exopolysaccharide biosynthesis protein [Proteobacteria bacterium]|nr:exopolysaccharide biosynthesis protein [Pseudomonadota bacterium]